MIFTTCSDDQPPERRPDYRAWCFRNGFLTNEVTEPVWIDTDAQTVTVRRGLPVTEPGDADFPEFRRDENNQPLTELVELPLVVGVPDWLVADRAEQTAA